MSERGAGLPKTSLDPNTILGGQKSMSMNGSVSQSGWFGPLQPLSPIAPKEVAGRQWDLPPGYNITARPRAYESVSFDKLRALADAYDLLRLVIETRKDQMDRMNWSFRAKKGNGGQKSKSVPQSRIDVLTKFFTKPDGEHNFNQWLRMILEDLFVIDAPTLWKQRDRSGKLIALHPLDGGTIKRVIDDWGRTPGVYTDQSTGSLVKPPAYQQVLKGYPAVNYTVDDIIYAPRNIRTHKVYGFSPVEQIIMTVNIALRRQLGTLDYYTEGNVPSALIGVPDAWTPDQIKNFQDYWDLYFTGDTAARRKAKFVPGGVAKTYVPTKEPELKSVFDEWLARVVCFAFSVAAQPFVSQVNRSTAGTQKEMAEEEGLAPILMWVKHLIDEIVLVELDEPDVEFIWGADEQIQPELEATILSTYTGDAIMTINEARGQLGLEPVDVPEADQLGYATPNGFVYLDEKLKPPPQAPLAPVGPDGQPIKQQMPGQKTPDGPKPKTPAGPKSKTPAGPKEKDDAPSAAKSEEISDLEKTGHDVSGEGRDNRGRFTSSGGPTARERAKAERNAQRDPESESIVRDDHGRFKKGRITKARMIEIAKKVTGKIALGAALGVTSAAIASLGGDKSFVGGSIADSAHGMAKVAMSSSAKNVLATAIRYMGAEAVMADKFAGVIYSTIFDRLFPKEEKLAIDGDMSKSDDDDMSDEEFALKVARVILPKFTEQFSDSLMTNLDAHGVSQDKLDVMQEALDDTRSEILAAISQVTKAEYITFLQKGMRQLDPIPLDRPATSKAVKKVRATLSKALQKAGVKAATLVAERLKDVVGDAAKALEVLDLVKAGNGSNADHIASSLDLSDIEDVVIQLGEDLAGASSDAAHRTIIQIGPDDTDSLVGKASDAATRWAHEHAAEMLGKKTLPDGSVIDANVDGHVITDSTRSMVKNAIVSGLAAGDSLDDIVAKVKDVGFSSDRAQIIAENEVATANSAGTLEGYAAAEAAGVAVMKGWLTVGDDRVDDICKMNEDQGPIPINQPFQSGHMHCPGHNKCRCSIVPYVGATSSDDESDDSDSEDDLAEKMLKYSDDEARDSHGRWTSGSSSSAATIASGAVTVVGLAAAAYFGRGAIGNLIGPIIRSGGSVAKEVATDIFSKGGVTAQFYSLTNDTVKSVLTGKFAGLDLAAKNTLASSGGKFIHVMEEKTGSTLAFVFGNLSSTGKNFHIHWILPGNLATVKTIEDGVGQLGMKKAVALKDIVATKFPSLESISGYRISGARTGRAEQVISRIRRGTTD